MCYCPTPTLHLNLALTGDGAFLLSPQKTLSVWFISVLNYGDTENVLINHTHVIIQICVLINHINMHTHTHTQGNVFVLFFTKIKNAKFLTYKTFLYIFLRNCPLLNLAAILFSHPSFVNILDNFFKLNKGKYQITEQGQQARITLLTQQ